MTEWKNGDRVRVVGLREEGGLPIGTEGVVSHDGSLVVVAKHGKWFGPAIEGIHIWEKISAEPPASDIVMFSIRRDHLAAMVEVVAAARAWVEGNGEYSYRLADAVVAYERALAGDGA